jgi:PIN domain nuclease of toxin-antitoxin system
MPLLLDTHVILWMAQQPERLPDKVRDKLNSEDVLLFSYASVWEIAIKSAISKIELQWSIKEFVDLTTEKHALQMLQISLPHIYQTQQLPLHHRDPFDRLLVAQSIIENIPIISSDVIFDVYGIERIW